MSVIEYSQCVTGATSLGGETGRCCTWSFVSHTRCCCGCPTSTDLSTLSSWCIPNLCCLLSAFLDKQVSTAELLLQIRTLYLRKSMCNRTHRILAVGLNTFSTHPVQFLFLRALKQNNFLFSWRLIALDWKLVGRLRGKQRSTFDCLKWSLWSCGSSTMTDSWTLFRPEGNTVQLGAEQETCFVVLNKLHLYRIH